MKRRNQNRCWAGVSAVAPLLLAGWASTAMGQTQPSGVALKVGGFIKLDALSSAYQDGDVEAGNIWRDFYVPAGTPIGGADESRDTDFHAKSSRINFETTTQIEDTKVVSFVELDFMTADATAANERATNGYRPQLRHAYFTFDKWLFGQTWSTFQNPSALPEALDYIGPSEGTVFVRQAQARYTYGPWQFSVENPETTVVAFGGTGSGLTDDGGVPDVVARYNLAGDWGNLVVAALLRDLTYEDVAADVDDNVTGYGVSVSGKIMLGSRDDLRFMVTGGSGIGRYVGLNTIGDASLDAGAAGDLEAVDVISAFIAYRHVWSDKLRSSVFYSALQGDYDEQLVGGAITEATESYHANLLYSPVAKITLGLEAMYAKRELVNDADGTLNRLQFSAKYDF